MLSKSTIFLGLINISVYIAIIIFYVDYNNKFNETEDPVLKHEYKQQRGLFLLLLIIIPFIDIFMLVAFYCYRLNNPEKDIINV